MNEQAYLCAAYMLGTRYHSGQSKPGFRLLCQAQLRARDEFTGWDIGRTVSQLNRGLCSIKFRNAVAFWLKRMRRSRRRL